MKYKAIIETDDFKNFEFFEDGNGKYIHGIDAGAVNNEWIPLYFTECEQEPFINKPCVSSSGVCEHDKNNVLDKIRAEIKQNSYPIVHGVNNHERGMTLYGILQVIDKYRAESEETICK